jgi:hypothetical protein
MNALLRAVELPLGSLGEAPVTGSSIERLAESCSGIRENILLFFRLPAFRRLFVGRCFHRREPFDHARNRRQGREQAPSLEFPGREEDRVPFLPR